MLYVMGGGNFSPLTQVMKYDPSTNKWAKGPSLPVASSFGGAVKLRSGDVVYAGGVGANGTLSNVWELSTK
jgi:N-acetylneuraminic acid mutarotase